ncbi:hypothetical protein EN817_17625 [Mesorhizobium sp. M3A.F.Ca.ET.174.01.1.1]|nr:hypothetical protein EN817_17625 [Mesorhizobium sp. M3A.F.Ca.ET.174.01.1.1]
MNSSGRPAGGAQPPPPPPPPAPSPPPPPPPSGARSGRYLSKSFHMSRSPVKSRLSEGGFRLGLWLSGEIFHARARSDPHGTRRKRPSTWGRGRD